MEKIKFIGNMIRWFLGITLLFGGAVTITKEPMAAIATLLLASLFIPPLEKAILQKLKLKMPAWGKFLLGIFLFGIMVATTPSSPKTEVKEVEPKNELVTETQIPSTSVEMANSSPSGEIKKFYGVAKIIDGDTVQVSIEGKTETLRLIGIDTPESVDPRKPVQCFALEASKKAKEILTGKKVLLEADPTQGEKDKYNRLLRYIFLEDGTNFNKMMISEGYGHQYTYSKPYKYMEEFKQAETEARVAKKGLWADGACLVALTPTITPTTKAIYVAPKVTTVPAKTVTTQPNGGGSYVCGTKTKCGEMSTCAEARYFLTTCGLTRLDADHDGIPCESICN